VTSKSTGEPFPADTFVWSGKGWMYTDVPAYRMVKDGALSGNSVHVVALASNHDIPSPRSGQPSVIVRAVQAVVGAARNHAPLPPCRRLFSGSDVRCRRS